MKKAQVIDGIEPGSIAEELELLPGDEILAINGQEIEDVLDYRFLCRDEYLEILVRRGDDEAVFEVEKDEDEELGIIFENGLMDEYRSCRNKCIFCFIDQNPPGMRETLYFKDDDARLSFLQGNYITLTNLSDRELSRIIRYRLSPINISVQTMNPELRCVMLHNRFAGEALKKMDRLYEAGIEMNAQIVLCPGYNDGAELEDSLEKLSRYLPVLQSVSVVPVGLTKHRKGLTPLRPVSEAEAEAVIDLVETWQEKAYQKYGLHFVHASDEFYLKTGRQMPPAETYDDYLQLENGVGMVRLLHDEFLQALEAEEGDEETDDLSIVSGIYGRLTLQPLFDRFREKFPNRRVRLYCIRNDFFGELITVSGLVTGGDLIAQLRGKPLGSRLLMPVNMLRSGEEVLLDDVTVTDIQKELRIPAVIVQRSGNCLLDCLLGRSQGTDLTYAGYEMERL